MRPLSDSLRAKADDAADTGGGTLSAAERRAAELLSRVAPPPPLSAAALARIEGSVLGSPAPLPGALSGPLWRWLAVGSAGACAGVAATLAVTAAVQPAEKTQDPAALAVRELRAPQGSAAQLRTADGAELSLAGPGSLALAADGPVLADGRLLVRAGRTAVTVRTAGGRVTAPAHHVTAISMKLGQLARVAAYVGDSELAAAAQAAPAPVAAGTAWTPAGTRPLTAACVAAVAEPSAAWPACADEEADTAGATADADALPAEPSAGATGPAAEDPADDDGAPARVRPPRGPRPHRAARPATATSAEDTAAAAPGESALAAESRLLGTALHQLRQERDAGAALRTLTQYRDRFPAGLLAEEAQAARADALLALDRRGEALALLDQAELKRLGRGGELRVLRGELRAGASRCAEAVSDFGAVLAGSPPPAVAERALAGRAACYGRLGDAQRARADWQALKEQAAPQSPAARAAAQALKELP